MCGVNFLLIELIVTVIKRKGKNDDDDDGLFSNRLVFFSPRQRTQMVMRVRSCKAVRMLLLLLPLGFPRVFSCTSAR